MMKTDIKRGDIVILNEAIDRAAFIGCLFVVEEPRSWGVVGYVPALDGNIYPLRVNWEQMEATGGNIEKYMKDKEDE